MFQTNEGPSFPSHQFLFTGTSAPVAPHDATGYGIDFVADNPPLGYEFDDSGCAYTNAGGKGWPTWVQADGSTEQPPPLLTECFTHDSLVTDANDCASNNCNRGNLTWRYYSPTPDGIIWDAPEGVPEVCYEQNSRSKQGQACGGTEWNTHMSFYNSFGGAPIFRDIANCQLPKITWVTPDGAWSDHPSMGSGSPPMGPSWVGNIINAIGNSYANSNQTCDYWGYPAHQGVTPEPTAIFVVWDDWGGFFDHVPPYKVYRGSDPTHCPDADAPNGWGCGYTYGFRVPFLAVSEYTGTLLSNGQYSGYISAPCGATGQQACPNQTQIYQHDSGSILAFTEYNFNLPFIDSADDGYADYNAPDWGLTFSSLFLRKSRAYFCDPKAPVLAAVSGRGLGPSVTRWQDLHSMRPQPRCSWDTIDHGQWFEHVRQEHSVAFSWRERCLGIRGGTSQCCSIANFAVTDRLLDCCPRLSLTSKITVSS